MSMSKTAAIKTASQAIKVTGGAWNWRVVGPWNNNLNGPSTERSARDYWDARIKRTRWAAQLALHLMGRDTHGEHFYTATFVHCESNVYGIVDTAIRLEDQAANKAA